ncbi:MAG: nucleotidyltransferase family protein [Campylobacterota bacterium]
MQKDEIIKEVKKLKPKYEKEGLILVGLFGSYAKDTQTPWSDVDIAYTIDYDTFSKSYKDGFSKLLRIEDIKKELQKTLQTNVDFVPDTNTTIFEDIIYV